MTDSETPAEPKTNSHAKADADSKRAASKSDEPIDAKAAKGDDVAAKGKDAAEANTKRAGADDKAGEPADSKASAAEGASAGEDEPVAMGEDVTLSAKEYHELTEERDEYKDKFIRKVAELDNVIRRSAKEKSDLAKFGNEGFIKELLPVLDSFDQALPDEAADGKAGDSPKGSTKADGGEDFAAGIALVKKKLLDVFAKNGVEVVDDKGQPFDPNRHQAIQKIEDAEVEIETVSEQYQKGYTLNGRLVRPAMVVVAVPTKK